MLRSGTKDKSILVFSFESSRPVHFSLDWSPRCYLKTLEKLQSRTVTGSIALTFEILFDFPFVHSFTYDHFKLRFSSLSGKRLSHIPTISSCRYLIWCINSVSGCLTKCRNYILEVLLNRGSVSHFGFIVYGHFKGKCFSFNSCLVFLWGRCAPFWDFFFIFFFVVRQ